MRLKAKLNGHHYQFRDVKDVLAKANEEKSGRFPGRPRRRVRRGTGGGQAGRRRADPGGPAEQPCRAVRGGRGDPGDPGRGQRVRLRAGQGMDRRRAEGVAHVRRGGRRAHRLAFQRPDQRDDRGGGEALLQPRPDVRLGEDQEGQALQYDPGASRDPWAPPPAEPSRRRRPGGARLHDGRPGLRLRRRGDRAEPVHRQP